MRLNTPERVLYQNQAAGTLGPFVLLGGTYWLESKSGGAGTIDLKRRNPDGVTFVTRGAQITTTPSAQTVVLGGGTYELVISGFTGTYIEITRIPSAVE